MRRPEIFPGPVLALNQLPLAPREPKSGKTEADKHQNKRWQSAWDHPTEGIRHDAGRLLQSVRAQADGLGPPGRARVEPFGTRRPQWRTPGGHDLRLPLALSSDRN